MCNSSLIVCLIISFKHDTWIVAISDSGRDDEAGTTPSFSLELSKEDWCQFSKLEEKVIDEKKKKN